MDRPFDPNLLDALERSTIERWEGRVWRVLIGQGEPRRPNSRGARWNPPGLEALYSSLTEAGAHAEIQYHVKRQPVRVSAPLMTHQLTVKLTKVLDISSEKRLAAAGLERERLLALDLRDAQLVGSAAGWLGCSGLLVPSARSGATNLVILVNNMATEDVIDVDS